MASGPTLIFRRTVRRKSRSLHLWPAACGVLVGAVLLGGLFSVPQSRAQEVDPERLEELEKEVEERGKRVDEMREETDRLDRESRRLRRRTVDAAERIQRLENRLSTIEERLVVLLQQEIQVVDRLKVRQRELASIIAALQAVERNRPPALVVRPDDAVDAARSASLLAAVVPELRDQAISLGNELDGLERLRTQIKIEREELSRSSVALRREQKNLEALLAETEEKRETSRLGAALEADQLNRARAEMEDLRSLIDGLERRAAAALPRPKPAVPGDIPGRSGVYGPVLGPGQSPAVDPVPPSKRFAEAKGRLRPPVAGRVVQTFNQELGPGLHADGIRLRTRPGAQVVAPYDSVIVFAEPFKSAGHVLILSAGEGYLLVLAGLDQIYGVEGQELLAGEPVGRMGGEGGSPRLVEAATSGAGAPALADDASPELYFELRRNGRPVDPLPWLAAGEGKG